MIHAGMQETVDLGAKVAEEPLVLPWLDKADLDADGRINAKSHHLANKPFEPGKVLANDLVPPIQRLCLAVPWARLARVFGSCSFSMQCSAPLHSTGLPSR